MAEKTGASIINPPGGPPLVDSESERERKAALKKEYDDLLFGKEEYFRYLKAAFEINELEKEHATTPGALQAALSDHEIIGKNGKKIKYSKLAQAQKDLLHQLSGRLLVMEKKHGSFKSEEFKNDNILRTWDTLFESAFEQEQHEQDKKRARQLELEAQRREPEKRRGAIDQTPAVTSSIVKGSMTLFDDLSRLKEQDESAKKLQKRANRFLKGFIATKIALARWSHFPIVGFIFEPLFNGLEAIHEYMENKARMTHPALADKTPLKRRGRFEKIILGLGVVTLGLAIAAAAVAAGPVVLALASAYLLSNTLNWSASIAPTIKAFSKAERTKPGGTSNIVAKSTYFLSRAAALFFAAVTFAALFTPIGWAGVLGLAVGLAVGSAVLYGISTYAEHRAEKQRREAAGEGETTKGAGKDEIELQNIEPKMTDDLTDDLNEKTKITETETERDARIARYLAHLEENETYQDANETYTETGTPVETSDEITLRDRLSSIQEAVEGEAEEVPSPEGMSKSRIPIYPPGLIDEIEGRVREKQTSPDSKKTKEKEGPASKENNGSKDKNGEPPPTHRGSHPGGG